MTPPTNTTQLQVDIAEIKGQLCTLSEIKVSFDSLTKSIAGFREQYIKEHGLLENKANSAHTRIDNMAKELEEIKATQKDIGKLLPFIRVQVYVITGLSLPIAAAILWWVWSLISHTP